MTRPYIAICGAGVASTQVEVLAEETGRLVAEAGAVLLCGGLGGVMEGACRGAKSAGGTTVGILPGLSRADANEFVDIAIPTGIGEMRNFLIVRAADVVIAISGEFGTLSEIALALKIGTPVVGLDTWDLDRSEIARAARPQEAVAKAVELAAGNAPGSSLRKM
jgi:uncharacterized protein (TIGR00725 family)